MHPHHGPLADAVLDIYHMPDGLDSDLIALGHVVSTRSFWNDDLGIIETESILKLDSLLKGSASGEIIVRTEGGYLPDKGLGMVVPHEASFQTGEDAIILAKQDGEYYRIRNGVNGKVSLNGRTTHGQIRLDATIVDAAQPRQLLDTRRWNRPQTSVTYRVNINTDQAGAQNEQSAAFINAITAAAETWNRTPGADFSLKYAGTTGALQTGYNQVNEIVFMPKGADNRAALAQVWYTSDLSIVEADIWINDDYLWDVSGDLPEDRLDLQSVLVHEFGHWLILDHTADSDSVMYPTLSPGSTKRQLGRYDVEGIVDIYPCTQASCLPDRLRSARSTQ